MEGVDSLCGGYRSYGLSTRRLMGGIAGRYMSYIYLRNARRRREVVLRNPVVFV